MVYYQKHIDQPMSLLDLTRRQVGRNVYEYFDMDGPFSTVFPDFYGSRGRHFHLADDWLGAVYGASNRHRHNPVCRSGGLSGLRCLLSVPAGWAMGPVCPVADSGPAADSNILPLGNHYRPLRQQHWPVQCQL